MAVCALHPVLLQWVQLYQSNVGVWQESRAGTTVVCALFGALFVFDAVQAHTAVYRWWSIAFRVAIAAIGIAVLALETAVASSRAWW